MSQAHGPTPFLLFVRFEQGRGVSGVPKTWIPYLAGHPKNAAATPSVPTLVRMAVEVLRAMCADPNQGHGRDLMPEGDYHLHKVDGGLIEKVEDIPWETVEGQQRAELVLTYENPAELLAVFCTQNPADSRHLAAS